MLEPTNGHNSEGPLKLNLPSAIDLRLEITYIIGYRKWDNVFFYKFCHAFKRED